MNCNYLCYLQFSGKIPVKNGSLIKITSNGEIDWFSIFKKVHRILKGPTDLPFLSSDIMDWTSTESVGERKKVCSHPPPPPPQIIKRRFPCSWNFTVNVGSYISKIVIENLSNIFWISNAFPILG